METQLDTHLGRPSNKIPNAVAVLVLGIVSIPTCVCFGLVGLTCGIISLVLHKKGMTEYNMSPENYDPGNLGMMKAGKICAIVGICLSAIYLVYYIVMLSMFGSEAFNAFELMQQEQQGN